MQPFVSVITLGVDDLERSLRFYRAMGLMTDGIIGTEFECSATECTLGHNVRSREDVDAVMADAEAAGAVVVKPARPTFRAGYAGYFQDPDSHLCEAVWNPALIPGEQSTRANRSRKE